MRRLTTFVSLLLLLLPHSSPANPAPVPQFGSSYGPLPVFEFHSGFWINLHHTLYQAAKQKNSATTPNNGSSVAPQSSFRSKPSSPPLAPAEQRAWNDALSYYSANFISHDLLFSTDMILLKNQLGDFDDCDELSGTKNKLCNAGLQPRLTQILEAAATVYRAHQWPEHDRVNRRWILRVAPLVREQGIGLSERLADIYQTHWPKAKIRVDVTEFAYPSGAYTTLEPLRVTISSTDPRNQDAAALEVLFHEASHGIAEPVEQAIIRECRQRSKPIPRDLWHALIFYTTAEVIRPVLNTPRSPDAVDALPPSALATPPPTSEKPFGSLASQSTSDHSASVALSPITGTPANAIPSTGPSAPGYTRDSLRELLSARGWDDYYKLLDRFWQPYLDGRASYDDAIAHMVSSL